MKINGRTILSKESIRQWYKETNEQLPLHHRLSLLQTKLLEKLGGLQKTKHVSNGSKIWRKNSSKNLYATDPNLEYTEQKERSLRKKLANQIVRKRFRPNPSRDHELSICQYNETISPLSTNCATFLF